MRYRMIDYYIETFLQDHKPKVKVNIVSEKPTSGWIRFPDLVEAEPIKAQIFEEIIVEVYVVDGKLRARVLPK